MLGLPPNDEIILRSLLRAETDGLPLLDINGNDAPSTWSQKEFPFDRIPDFILVNWLPTLPDPSRGKIDSLSHLERLGLVERGIATDFPPSIHAYPGRSGPGTIFLRNDGKALMLHWSRIDSNTTQVRVWTCPRADVSTAGRRPFAIATATKKRLVLRVQPEEFCGELLESTEAPEGEIDRVYRLEKFIVYSLTTPKGYEEANLVVQRGNQSEPLTAIDKFVCSILDEIEVRGLTYAEPLKSDQYGKSKEFFVFQTGSIPHCILRRFWHFKTAPESIRTELGPACSLDHFDQAYQRLRRLDVIVNSPQEIRPPEGDFVRPADGAIIRSRVFQGFREHPKTTTYTYNEEKKGFTNDRETHHVYIKQKVWEVEVVYPQDPENNGKKPAEISGGAFESVCIVHPSNGYTVAKVDCVRLDRVRLAELTRQPTQKLPTPPPATADRATIDAIAKDTGAKNSPTTAEINPDDVKGPLGCPDLAVIFNVPKGPLEQRLIRARNAGELVEGRDFFKNDEAVGREARILYKVSAIVHHINGLREADA